MSQELCLKCRQPFDDWAKILDMARTERLPPNARLSSYHEYKHYETISALKSSADNGCLLCHMFIFSKTEAHLEDLDEIAGSLSIYPMYSMTQKEDVGEWFWNLRLRFEQPPHPVGALLVIAPAKNEGMDPFLRIHSVFESL